jgi:hypothetical protein
MKPLPTDQNYTFCEKSVFMPGRNHQAIGLTALDEVFAERDKNFLYPCCYGGTSAQASSQV